MEHLHARTERKNAILILLKKQASWLLQLLHVLSSPFFFAFLLLLNHKTRRVMMNEYARSRRLYPSPTTHQSIRPTPNPSKKEPLPKRKKKNRRRGGGTIDYVLLCKGPMQNSQTSATRYTRYVLEFCKPEHDAYVCSRLRRRTRRDPQKSCTASCPVPGHLQLDSITMTPCSPPSRSSRR